ncbi:flagellar hook-associated family protein [Consotaella salsifontis]|uniref:Flagellin n=1 Tax=Consotaella salsifontis TaxID=1365950 RepID=A0A1T4NSJ0_9HYPH|nr:flagellar hook-associated family protein [Consotaella salsifontis]SJZ82102.1 flagellar hook-associated protein 3 FlgL [Consotaella salsifontis]
MSISTLSLITAQRTTILRSQEQIRDAEKEVSTGRHADVGASLGATTGQAVTLRVELSSVDSQRTSNNLIGVRLDSMQDVLSGLQKSAQSFNSALVTGQTASVDISTLVTQANAGLEQLFGALNTATNGQYLFAGTNTSEQPSVYNNLQDYEGSPAQEALLQSVQDYKNNVDSTFSLATATQTQMEDFLNSSFASLFDYDPDNPSDADASTWKSLWSNSNSDPVLNKITSSESIDVSANANLGAFRDLLQGYAMMAGLGTQNLSEGARNALVSKASSLTSGAVSGLIGLQGDIGLRQERLEAANDRLDSKKAVVKASISSLEDVDVYEASTRVTMLTTQLEAAYSLTSKLQGLSLLNYL